MKTLLFLLMVVSGAALAQNATPTPQPSPSPSRLPLWKCDLQGGTYEVALRSIVSVSVHEYIADAAARVTEMNIDTMGNMAVRFYFLEPVTTTVPVGQATLDRARQLAEQVSGRVSTDRPWENVVKNYPTSTHAHTIEYRLDSADEIQTLFKSADTAFRLNQNTEIRVP